jgi:hypothetical protein
MHRLAALRLGENAANAVFIIANYRRVRQHRPPFAHRVAREKSGNPIRNRITDTKTGGIRPARFAGTQISGNACIRKRGALDSTFAGSVHILSPGKRENVTSAPFICHISKASFPLPILRKTE